jgi:hypothetical protein
MIKYRNITAKALDIGDKILTRKAISSLIGTMEATRPSNRKNGLPGG